MADNKSFVLSVVIATVVGSVVTMLLTGQLDKKEKTAEELVKEFYLIENAVHVSPHGLRGKMDKGDTSFVLVDLRSREEYEREHILGAVNIPAYSDPNTSAYDDIDRIVGEFRTLISANPDKDIIVYCYSIPCMTGRKIGKMLTENDIYVKHLGIGWNEWRYYWNLWNHEHEWNTKNVESYIWKGAEPGAYATTTQKNSSCSVGEFGC